MPFDKQEENHTICDRFFSSLRLVSLILLLSSLFIENNDNFMGECFPFPDPFINFDKLCFLASLGAIMSGVTWKSVVSSQTKIAHSTRSPSLPFPPDAQRMNCCGCLCRTCSLDTDSVLLLSQHRVISKQIKYLFIMMLCECASILIGSSLLNVGAEVLFDKLQLLFCFRVTITEIS